MSCLLNVIEKDKKAFKSKDSFFTNNLVISDLDSFFQDIYSYYYHGGYNNIVTRVVLDNITYIFTIHFLMFNLFFVEWSRITSLNSKDNEKIELTAYISNKNFESHKFFAFTFYSMLLIYYLKFMIGSIYKFYNARTTHFIYKNKLRVRQSDLEMMTFDQICDLIIELQKKENFCRVKDTLTKFDIISRINRKENYIIALISNKVISFKLFGFDIMTTYLYLSLKRNFMSFVFKQNEADINKSFHYINLYRLKIVIQILFQIIGIPGEVIFRIIFFLFKNADNFRTKRNFCMKQWNTKTLIEFKNYNELKHNFEKRISLSYLPTEFFITSFKKKFYSILNKAIVLIGGSIVLVFIVVSCLNVNIANVTVKGYNFIAIICIIGLIISYFNSDADSTVNNINSFDPEDKIGLYKKMIYYLQNIPTKWNKTKINKNFKIVNKVFYNNVLELFNEVISIVFFPFLWFQLVINAKDIIDFIKTFSTRVEGLGTLCSFSILNPSVYQSISEKSSVLTQSDQRFRDEKFINSMIYFEENFNDTIDIEENNDNDTVESLDINESHHLNGKEKIILKSSVRNIIIDQILQSSKESKETIQKNIFYYISSSAELNLRNVIEIMSAYKTNHVHI